MNKMFSRLIAAFALCIFSGFVFGGTGQTFEPTDAGKKACESAASPYKVTPWVGEGPSWYLKAEKHTLSVGQCVMINTAKRLVNTSGKSLEDYRYVFLQAGTEFVLRFGRWLVSVCLNDSDFELTPLTYVQPAPQSTQATQLVTPVITTSSCGIDCQLAKHNEAEAPKCLSPMVFVPATKSSVISNCAMTFGHTDTTIVNRKEELVVNASNSSKLNDTRKPLTVDVPQGQMTVNSTKPAVNENVRCAFDCVSRAVARDVVGFQNQPSLDKQCEQRWKAPNGETGRVLLDKNLQDGKLRLSSVRAMATTIDKVWVSGAMASTVKNCDEDQAIAKANWNTVVQKLGLPPVCEPVK